MIRRRFGEPMSAAVMERARELLREISETADEIRDKAATIKDQTPPHGIQRDT